MNRRILVLFICAIMLFFAYIIFLGFCKGGIEIDVSNHMLFNNEDRNVIPDGYIQLLISSFDKIHDCHNELGDDMSLYWSMCITDEIEACFLVNFEYDRCIMIIAEPRALGDIIRNKIQLYST